MSQQPPPHIVVLVDNFIEGDSRVQKTVTSMTALGWKVTLVGRRRKDAGPLRRTVAGLPALTVFVRGDAAAPRQMDRPVWYRSPLAYRSGRKQTHRLAMSEAAIVARRFDIDVAKGAGRDRGVRRFWLRGRMLIATRRRALAQQRAAAGDALREQRRLRSGACDKAATSMWKTVRRNAAWEQLDPGIWDWELAYGPLVDRLQPDLIHANDHRMLAIAARAAARARTEGRDVKVVWDAHELLEGLETAPTTSRSWMPAQIALERAHARYADAVVTVSERLAEILQESHRLPELPLVVRNAPVTADVQIPETGLREAVGLADDLPLLVYSGSLSRERSVTTVVEALPDVPGIHFVLVVGSPEHPLVVEALELAVELGVADRVHTAPYVPVESIVPYLAAADVGVHPILHGPNNEIALPTKFYEYSQARLPVVVTDVKVMAETVRQTGMGEVFRAGDSADLARALRAVFAAPETYRAALAPDLLAEWTWERQADLLHDLYVRLLGRGPQDPHR